MTVYVEIVTRIIGFLIINSQTVSQTIQSGVPDFGLRQSGFLLLRNLLIIIIIMVIFKCYFSGELIALT